MSKQSLKDYIITKLTERGDTDITVTNIRTVSKDVLMADVSYTWRLHGWKKRAEHKDSLFVYKDDKWHSPLLMCT